jgi:hypothetical protein
MALYRTTTDDLIAEVRSLLDVDSTLQLDATTDIIPALNRAQVVACEVLASTYDEPLIESHAFSSVSDVLALPEDIFGDRWLTLELEIAGIWHQISRINPKNRQRYQRVSNPAAYRPNSYYISGKNIHVVPGVNAVTGARGLYLRAPHRLVPSQGLIMQVNVSGNYVWVDEAGTDLSEASDKRESYVNVIDGETGKVKVSLQISSINATQITFRSTPLRSTVLGHTISGSITADLIAADDYLCGIQGSCVPLLKSSYSVFVIYSAVLDLQQKLGQDVQLMFERTKALEKFLQRSWTSSEPTAELALDSPVWRQIRFRTIGKRG